MTGKPLVRRMLGERRRCDTHLCFAEQLLQLAREYHPRQCPPKNLPMLLPTRPKKFLFWSVCVLVVVVWFAGLCL